MSVYPRPDGLAPSARWRVMSGGREAFVMDTPVGAVCSLPWSGPVEVLTDAPSLEVRPRRLGVRPEPVPGGFGLPLTGPTRAMVEVPDRPPLHLFADPASEPPPGARVIPPGVHDLGLIELEGGALFLSGGAVVRGHLIARGDGVRIGGPGWFDGSAYPHHAHRQMVFDGCRDLRVSDVVSLGSPSWNLVLGACEDVAVEGIKIVGWVVCSDGVDVVGSRRVKVRDSFLRCNDDCVAVKAVSYNDREEGHRTDWRRDVSDVLVERCEMHNDRAGNVMEIGFETSCDVMERITFRDVDVLAGHGEGGVFTIHAGDRAEIRDVLYEDVRVEHFYDKLLDVRILRSRYSQDAERGRVRGVTLRNVETVADPYNTTSLIGGYDAEHDVRGVTIENLVIGGQRVRSGDDFGLYTKHASGVEIR